MCSMANPQIVHNLTSIWRICHTCKSTFHSIPRFYESQHNFLNVVSKLLIIIIETVIVFYIIVLKSSQNLKICHQSYKGRAQALLMVKRIEKAINMKPLDAWRQGQSHLKKQIKLFIFNKIQCILHIIQLCQHKILGQIQVNSVQVNFQIRNL